MTTTAVDLAWFTLFSARGLGPVGLHTLHRAAGAAGIGIPDLVETERDDVRLVLQGVGARLGERIRGAATVASAEFARLSDRGVRVVHLDHPSYPRLIVERMGDGAPPVLFASGAVPLLEAPGVAIVGSRHASPEALKAAQSIAAELAGAAMNVVSGYAGGIDTVAHLGALEADGTTTMVLSSGILEFSRKPVFARVRWDGNVLGVSQFEPGMRWNARAAMTRNRLVCALSQAVLVIESGVHGAKMSGTFDAGLAALDMGVPLFVIDPEALPDCPPGNAELAARGGILVRPDQAVAAIIAHERVRCADGNHGGSEEQHQLALF